jgi:hypothetical protein
MRRKSSSATSFCRQSAKKARRPARRELPAPEGQARIASELHLVDGGSQDGIVTGPRAAIVTVSPSKARRPQLWSVRAGQPRIRVGARRPNSRGWSSRRGPQRRRGGRGQSVVRQVFMLVDMRSESPGELRKVDRARVVAGVREKKQRRGGTDRRGSKLMAWPGTTPVRPGRRRGSGRAMAFSPASRSGHRSNVLSAGHRHLGGAGGRQSLLDEWMDDEGKERQAGGLCSPSSWRRRRALETPSRLFALLVESSLFYWESSRLAISMPMQSAIALLSLSRDLMSRGMNVDGRHFPVVCHNDPSAREVASAAIDALESARAPVCARAGRVPALRDGCSGRMSRRIALPETVRRSSIPCLGCCRNGDQNPTYDRTHDARRHGWTWSAFPCRGWSGHRGARSSYREAEAEGKHLIPDFQNPPA